MLWSFSRDHGMPFSFLWSRVNRYFGIPVNAVRPGMPSFSSTFAVAAAGSCHSADFVLGEAAMLQTVLPAARLASVATAAEAAAFCAAAQCCAQVVGRQAQS